MLVVIWLKKLLVSFCKITLLRDIPTKREQSSGGTAVRIAHVISCHACHTCLNLAYVSCVRLALIWLTSVTDDCYCLCNCTGFEATLLCFSVAYTTVSGLSPCRAARPAGRQNALQPS